MSGKPLAVNGSQRREEASLLTEAIGLLAGPINYSVKTVRRVLGCHTEHIESPYKILAKFSKAL